ncbi:hypothetical protein LEMLEM_LOCUS7527 [Lemmus lemmus]
MYRFMGLSPSISSTNMESLVTVNCWRASSEDLTSEKQAIQVPSIQEEPSHPQAGVLGDTLHLAHFVSVDLLFIRTLHLNCPRTNLLC